MRVVLDANVFVSAILSPQGAPAQILGAWRDERFDLLISGAILDEIGRVLNYPRIVRRHQWPPSRICTFLTDLASIAISTPGDLHLEVITECPADNRYLECTIEGTADYIVSGNRHLLSVDVYEGIPILTPRTFLTVLEGTK